MFDPFRFDSLRYSKSGGVAKRFHPAINLHAFSVPPRLCPPPAPALSSAGWQVLVQITREQPIQMPRRAGAFEDPM